MKLIRDFIPEDMRKRGYEPQLRALKGQELRTALLEKLVEEAKEALADSGSIEELGDVYEVLCSIEPIDRIEDAACAKKCCLGGFGQGWLWENDDDPSPEAQKAREGYKAMRGQG